MTEIIVGVDGFIGSNLAKKLPDAIHTTHKPRPFIDGRWPFDLLEFGPLPEGDVVYICAGINGHKRCEGNPASHHINVDATIRLAKHYVAKGAFPVWLSSRSLEWSMTTYSRQKAMAECALITMPVGIVRAGRVTPQNVGDLCDTLISVGRGRKPDLFVWGTDDIAYQREVA